MSKKTENLDAILLSAMQGRPGWAVCDRIVAAPLAMCGTCCLEDAIREAGDTADIGEVEARAQVHIELMEELDLSPERDTDKSYLRRYSDDSVGLFTSGDSEAWITSNEAEMDLYQRVDADRWEADGYAAFFA